jgi:hypothetical protein
MPLHASSCLFMPLHASSCLLIMPLDHVRLRDCQYCERIVITCKSVCVSHETGESFFLHTHREYAEIADIFDSRELFSAQWKRVVLLRAAALSAHCPWEAAFQQRLIRRLRMAGVI